MTLEERLAHAAALSGGRMPVAVVVENEAERKDALAILKGKRDAKKITIKTRAESDAVLAARSAATARRWAERAAATEAA